MPDEPILPQKIIDDAAKALGENPLPISPPNVTPTAVETSQRESPVVSENSPVLPPPPPPPPPMSETKEHTDTPNVEPENIQSVSITPIAPTPPTLPESMIVPTKEKDEQKNTEVPTPKQPEKKKKGKGILIATILFFILTLPIAIYYVSQQQRLTESRSLAGGRCSQKRTSGLCVDIECNAYTNATSCTSGTGTCCQWDIVSTNTPTPNACAYQCLPVSCATAGMDSAGGTCSGSLTCCKPKIVFTPTKTPTTKPTATPTSGGSGGGCVAAGGSYVHINRTGFSCDVCTFGGIMTCAGPSGGSGGDPCKKYINGVLTSVSCEEVGMIRCNCGGNAWTAGKKGVSCVQLCDCAGINCDQCTPTPTKPTTVTNTPTTVVTNTPTPTTVVTNTPTPTTVVTNTPTNTPVVNTPQPGQCDASCGNDSDCESGLSCVVTGGIHRCRKNACPDEATCSCPAATPTTRTYVDNTPTTRTYVNNNTPTPTRVRLIAEVPTATPTEQPTPKIPVAGVGPGVFGAISVAGSILLLLIGLIL